ncbi:MAG: hypothetical protein ABJE47_19940 [bacterium]
MIRAETLFTPWESFYVIVGSSGAALTGLQFVVMALVADAQRKGNSETVGAYGTPTVVHFCAVLITSAILSAPWHGAIGPAVILAVLGLWGTGYATVVSARARRQQSYTPVLEDWIWHSMLPMLAYVTLFVGAVMTAREESEGMFAIGATSLLLLLVGIHNAWDSVAYVATLPHKDTRGGDQGGASS